MLRSFNKSNLKIAGLTLLFSLFATAIAPPNKASAEYDGGRLIDNNVFLDSSTMSANDIQYFLQSKGSGLASRSFVLNCYGADSKERQWYTAAGAPCDQTVPASTIIYYAAQVYGINPRVTLATLQKEQSLITSPNPTERQINQAMGYACPTTGQCSNGSTFFYQIDSGTWVQRYHYERASGNMVWWNTSSTWTCGSEKSFYKPSLRPNQNVSFYDEDGVYYRTHFIHSAATSSLYCYTPHAYNNPGGLYGLPVYGNTGRYYSGSYNFVKYFELWFGSVLGVPYYARYSTQTAYPTVYPGDTSLVSVTYRNIGSKFWKDDLTSFPGAPAVRLATTSPINRSSPFYDSSWTTTNRPSGILSAVYEADGVTLASDQHTVHPGQYGRYTFKLRVPRSIAPGVYQEHFQLVAEGDSSWDAGGQVYQRITVKPLFQARFVNQSSYPSLKQGDSKDVHFSYQNTGNTTWKDDDSVGADEKPVHLATTGPINRVSPFYDSSWASISRPAHKFSAVYEADGVTLAANQHHVNPGQIARFSFTMTAGTDASPRIYREFFQPIIEGATNWQMGGVVFLDVNVSESTLRAEFSLQSPYPSIKRGFSSQAFIQYRNAGTASWRDDQSKTGFIAPMRIATSSPINRTSRFAMGNWINSNRPTGTLTAVYNPDGSLAPNQHVVQPGQYGRYSFNLYAPLSMPPGQYYEYFQLIAEGSKNWDIGAGSTVWLRINVTD